MPKGNTNTKVCRKVEILGMLKQEHALSAVEMANKLGMHVRSIRRFLVELRKEKKVFRRYHLFGDGARRPTFYYSIRREK